MQQHGPLRSGRPSRRHVATFTLLTASSRSASCSPRSPRRPRATCASGRGRPTTSASRYLEQFNHAKAADAVRGRARRSTRTFTPARVNLAIARLYEPDLPAALKAATAASAAAGAPPHADFVLGLIARSENREEDALAAFRRVLEADPDDVASLVNLGQLQLQRREYAAAVPVFARAVELEPYNVSALYNLAVAQTRAGQRELGAATTAKFQALRETRLRHDVLEHVPRAGAVRRGHPVDGRGGRRRRRRSAALTYATPGPSSAFGTAGPSRPSAPAISIATGTATSIVVAQTGARRLRAHGSGQSHDDTGAHDLVAHAGHARRARHRRRRLDNDGKADLLLHGRGRRGPVAPGGSARRGARLRGRHGRHRHLDDARRPHRGARRSRSRRRRRRACSAGRRATPARAAPLAAWRNNGDGTFADITAAPCPVRRRWSRRAIVATDVDLRRDIDVLVLGDGRPAAPVAQHARRLVPRGGRRRSASTQLPAARAMAVGDFNKDGFPDIALSVQDGDERARRRVGAQSLHGASGCRRCPATPSAAQMRRRRQRRSARRRRADRRRRARRAPERRRHLRGRRPTA